MTNAELRRKLPKPPTHPPPPVDPPFELRPMRRPKATQKGSANRGDIRSSPGCPSDGTLSVAPHLLPRQRKPVIRHRGQELDPLVIFPPDDRRIYQDTNYPWRCVCQVQSGSNGGSGVLIGPRHVLTASHVIDWRTRKANIAVNRFDRTNEGTSQVIAAHYYEEITDVEYTNGDSDYAVLVLADRLGDRLGWLGCRRYHSEWDDNGKDWWRSIGYAGDVAMSARPVFQQGFQLDEDDLDLGSARALQTKTGDFMKGQSGSPIFSFWGDGPYAVAVVSADGGGYNWAAAGSDLPALVAEARSVDP